MRRILIRILERLYAIEFSFSRKIIRRLILKFDKDNHGNHGEYWSCSLRRIFQKYYGVSIGIGSYGCFDPVRFPSGTVIGNYCSIAAGVRYLNANHPLDKFTTHAMIFNKRVLQNINFLRGGGK